MADASLDPRFGPDPLFGPDPRFGLQRSVRFAADAPLLLDSGLQLAPLTIAY
jgi:hypothetical protein